MKDIKVHSNAIDVVLYLPAGVKVPSPPNPVGGDDTVVPNVAPKPVFGFCPKKSPERRRII